MAPSRPLAIDLYSGLGGWSAGLAAEGWYVIRFDLEDMCKLLGQTYPEHSSLVIQDVLTIHGAQFKDVRLIVSSSPCTEFSWRAMPWKRSKARAPDEVGLPAPEWWRKPTGEMTALERVEWESWQLIYPREPPAIGLALFDAQFKIQREACEAAGRHIPMTVENVRGAIPWVGRSRANFGSYHLWGDVPALMPVARPMKNGDGGSWFGLNPDGSPGALNNARDGVKVPMPPGGDSFKVGFRQTAELRTVREGRKGFGAGATWFDGNLCQLPSASPRRKAASAKIARIPLTLSRWIGMVHYPHGEGYGDPVDNRLERRRQAGHQ